MQLRGAILDGGYQLEDMIAADSDFAAFRVRVLGDASLDVVAHFYACEPSAAEEQAAVWQLLGQLRHPNLNTPLGAGRKDLDERTSVYLVMRRTEERLSGALEERALRPAEAGDLLKSLSGALKALDERGLVHGFLSPEHVLATEDAILLSTESVRPAGTKPAVAIGRPKYLAPESEDQNATPEADIWCLGATLFEALTRKECGQACREEGARLPLPFGRIVQRCLDPDPLIRCKLPEIFELYAPRNAQPEASPVGRRPLPAQSSALRLSRGWAYVAVAVIVLIAVIALARTGHHAASAPSARPVAASKPAWPTRTLAPESTPPKQAARDIRPHHDTSPAKHQDVWRLILYTYSQREDAEAQARKINQQHPGLNAEAFSPNGKGPYMVVAGGEMDHDTAAQLRSKARSIGLPRDAYIQNFRR